MEPRHVVILVTIGTPEEAARMADFLLEERQVACVNIVPGVDSRFRWEGRAQRETEALMIIKTTAASVDEVVRLVKERHPYDVPEVIALPIIGGNTEYLGWIEGETNGGDSGSDS